MWRPGFTYLEKRPALLKGFHRAFCVYSHHYRGTPEAPGLVLGLDQGGSCRGVAFAVGVDEWPTVKAYLDERELVTYAYAPRLLAAETPEGAVPVYTYVADPDHPQYAGDLGIERTAAIIMGAAGIAGLNRVYLINTLRHLESEGYTDTVLQTLLHRVERLTGIIEAGGGI
ncbi:MAG: gamma-glutamylcyclotransferase [Rhodospirillales bacterium]|nr:gamma-glutamylcyclotransferase [Rhodospirillales bacterium]